MAHFWSLVINIQIEILVFVRSTREGNFHLYVQSLRNLLKWLFALDHANCATWLTTHVLDFISLPTTHSDVYQQILKGFFSFAKTKCPFLQPNIMRITKKSDRNSTTMLSLFIKKFHVTPSK